MHPVHRSQGKVLICKWRKFHSCCAVKIYGLISRICTSTPFGYCSREPHQSDGNERRKRQAKEQGGRWGERSLSWWQQQKSEQLRGRQHLREIGANIPLAELIASCRGPKVVSPLAFMSTHTHRHTQPHALTADEWGKLFYCNNGKILTELMHHC